MDPIRLRLVPSGKEGELLAQGWIKQTTIGEPRLTEIVENYRNMGYEVHVVEHPAEVSGDSCNTCFSAGAEAGQMYGDVYIRGKAKPLEDDLF
ncbi:hypothetical protein EGT07_20690 [Herbaspirillum sp. HC18]|nr:hypothetical protein EGT07_20690 [Herbaspirillum sp. HC18]